MLLRINYCKFDNILFCDTMSSKQQIIQSEDEYEFVRQNLRNKTRVVHGTRCRGYLQLPLYLKMADFGVCWSHMVPQAKSNYYWPTAIVAFNKVLRLAGFFTNNFAVFGTKLRQKLFFSSITRGCKKSVRRRALLLKGKVF